MTDTPIRLTSLAHGGGCGCKIAPDVLSNLLAGTAVSGVFPQLLVGNQASDDAAVYRLNDEQALIATTDFFMPIVDDPTDFGRIAATNALSDIYAMGGTPILALALVGMPLQKLPADAIRAILAGGARACEDADVPIGGGHSIDSVEPIYGLAVMGLAHPDHIKRNDQAQAGDVLILSKALGVGVLSNALKKGLLDANGYHTMLNTMTKLNAVGATLAKMNGVHAMTDVTGFSLLGHGLEMCKGSQLAARLRFKAIPWLPQTRAFVEQGVYTGASSRNWHAVHEYVTLEPSLSDIEKTMLTDPQTSGGLLIACAPDCATKVLQLLHADGCAHAAIIGELEAGTPRLHVSN